MVRKWNFDDKRSILFKKSEKVNCNKLKEKKTTITTYYTVV